MAGDLKTEQQVISRFQELRMSVESMWNKIIELESESSEHELVIKTLEPMDPVRKCYRQIGDTLVERTVAETLPAVQRNKQNLEKAIQTLQGTLEARKKELSEFQAKYKIKAKGSGDDEEPSNSKAGERAGQGVLV